MVARFPTATPRVTATPATAADEEPTTSTATTTATATPVPPTFQSEVTALGAEPSQVEVTFSLIDDLGHAVVAPVEELRAAIRIFEMVAFAPTSEAETDETESEAADSGLGEALESLDAATAEGTPVAAVAVTDWEEIDYAETSFFVDTAEDLQLEVAFILDFTGSMAQARLPEPDGRTGIQAMLDAFEEAVDGLPGAHRIGVVEFHDRNVDPGILSGMTTDRGAVLDSVEIFANSPFESGSSRTWDSIATASSLFTSSELNPNVVKAIVFMSDGRDTSSVRSRGEAGEIAIANGIKLYAMGIGDVLEEDKLVSMVESTGGIYYPTKELEALQDQLRLLVGDLRGQYRVRYTTLRREGQYRTRVQIALRVGTWIFDSQPLNVASFYGLDTLGEIAIDPPAIDSSEKTAEVFVRARRLPRNISRFRFALETDKPVTVELVAPADGGLLEGWTPVGRDSLGFFDTSGSQALQFGYSGLLFKITISEFIEARLDIPFVLDNRIYPGGGGFSSPGSIFLGQQLFPSGRIAFRSDRDGNAEIYVMSFDGTGQKNLTNNIAGDFHPTWSPKGNFIAFDSIRNGIQDIYVMTDSGGNVKNLTDDPARDARPAWSPQGEFIAFDSDRDGNREIYVMRFDGKNPRRMTFDSSDERSPAWSPDGRRLVFTSDRDGNAEIYIMDINDPTAPPINFTGHPADDFRPVWSSDGKRIAFFSTRDGNREVYLKNTDGSGPAQNLTRRSDDDWDPVWSPAAGHLAFVSFRDGNGEIYTMEDTGTKFRNVTKNAANDWTPVWGPDRE